jgi:hypothetical protein
MRQQGTQTLHLHELFITAQRYIWLAKIVNVVIFKPRFKASAQLFTCAKVKAAGAECTHNYSRAYSVETRRSGEDSMNNTASGDNTVSDYIRSAIHEDFEHRATMDWACVNSCAAVFLMFKQQILQQWGLAAAYCCGTL